MKTGADISHHQASFDAATYKRSGEDFIIHKATEGTGHVDDQFASRWRNALAANLPRVAYHYAHPSNSPIDESNHFAAIARNRGWQAGDGWALDLEINEGAAPATLVRWADSWCNNVRGQLGGKGLFYTYVDFLFSRLGNPGRIPGGCLGWIARYRTDSPWAAPFQQPGGWPETPHVWQCSNGQSGCVKDVASIGRCDYNRMTDGAFAALFEGADMPLNTTTDVAIIEGAVKRAVDNRFKTLGTAPRVAVLELARRAVSPLLDDEAKILAAIGLAAGGDPTVILEVLRRLPADVVAAIKEAL